MLKDSNINEASASVVEVCRSLPDLNMEPTEKKSFNNDDTVYGSCITLIHPEGSWVLGIVGDLKTCEHITRSIFAMDTDSPVSKEEHVDALGEIVNMTAGLLKRKIVATGKATDIRLGLPLFVTGTDWFEYVGKKITVEVQGLAGPGLDLLVVIFFYRGSKDEVDKEIQQLRSKRE